MIGVTISQASVDAVKKALGDRAKQYKIHIAAAINATSKQAKILTARELKTEMPTVSIKALKSTLFIKTKAYPSDLKGVLKVYPGKAISIKYFNATQRAGGVSYKIAPRLKGDAFIPRAFIIKKFGGHVFLRTTFGKGSRRGPLKKQVGPSTADAFAKLGIEQKIIEMAKTELPKQINERIRFLNLKASGGLRGKQK